jgi:site-specific DNA-methyltransferase (adenine-specific)
MDHLVEQRRKPGEIRDAIFEFLRNQTPEASVSEIRQAVAQRMKGQLAESSVRSYLRLNTPGEFERTSRGTYRLKGAPLVRTAIVPSSDSFEPAFCHGQSKLYFADCFQWLEAQPANSFHAIVCDPPYGLVEYAPEQQRKLREGRGGIWRIPPAFDGHRRSPIPRFTVLNERDMLALYRYFLAWAKQCLRVLVPGGHIAVASNPLVSHRVSAALADAGLERRGEIIRLVMTLRGGDRPKNAHLEFPQVSVMARSMWEPWPLFRKPFSGRVQDNLRRWGTGGLRRPASGKPFGDVLVSHPTRPSERRLAPHPSLKPQSFLRPLVRAMLPLGHGIILDPFAGSGSTLAAAEAVGYPSVGVENDPVYLKMACEAIPRLHRLRFGASGDDKPSSAESALFPLD